MAARSKSKNYISRAVAIHLKRLKAYAGPKKAGLNVETVHQLRVHSRRLNTALGIFRDFFPEDALRRWRKQLRTFNDALGPLRDVDVASEFLLKHKRLFATKLAGAKAASWSASLRGERINKERSALARLKKLQRTGLIAALEKELGKMSRRKLPDEHGLLSALGGAMIMKRLEAMMALKNYAGRPTCTKELHQLRLAVKKLRYAMENFDPFYAGALNVSINHCKRLQTHLGDMHDYDVWLGRLPFLRGPLRLLRAGSYRKFKQAWQQARQSGTWERLDRCVKGRPGPIGLSAEEKVIGAALALARRCRYEKEHSHQVTKLALALFDELRALHKLKGRHRLLLQAGGILHDIGWIKGRARHHKTAREIIMKDRQLPLTAEERAFVALLARYHRRAMPKNTHKVYAGLSADNKNTVRKLASLLRVADGMDRNHTSNVTALACRVSADKVVVTLKTKAMNEWERIATEKKADLFEDVFKKDFLVHWTSVN
jgi:exopolyphosphatase/guanosine-5'-triphosphate,3'-diphosphate pyrophosphatase